MSVVKTGPAARGADRRSRRSDRSDRSARAGGRTARTLPLHLVLVIAGAVMAVPLVYAVLSGFKSTDQLSRNPIGLPDPWVPSNYTDILRLRLVLAADRQQHPHRGGHHGAGRSAVSALAAFAFARFAFRGREVLFTLFTMGLMFPFAVAILPLFVLLRTFGLLDNPLGVILPQAAFGLPLTIIILRGFFRDDPRRAGGGRDPGRLRRLRLLLAGPAAHGEARPRHRLRAGRRRQLEQLPPAAAGLQRPQVVDHADRRPAVPGPVLRRVPPGSSPTSSLAMVPALAFYAVAERQLIGGLTAGATKG